MLDNPLEGMENYLAVQPSLGPAIEIPRELFPKEPVATFIRHDDTASDSAEPAEVLPPELMQLPDFQMMWKMTHMGLGAYVGRRTGAECNLAELASNEAGQAASAEIYNAINNSPFWRDRILKAEMGMMGLVMAVGVHGGNCISVVRESAKVGAQKDQEGDQDD